MGSRTRGKYSNGRPSHSTFMRGFRNPSPLRNTLAAVAFAIGMVHFEEVAWALGKTVQARVYRENPVRTPALEVLPLLIDPDDDRLSNGWFQVRSCEDLGAARAVGDLGLVRVCSLRQAAVLPSDRRYAPEPRPPSTQAEPADPFAEVSAYHHMARTISFVQSRISSGEPPLREPLEVVVGASISSALLERVERGADSLVGLEGAYYFPRTDPTGALVRESFGTERGLLCISRMGGINLAYDGDAIAHETAHAIMDNGHRLSGFRATPDGLSREPDALSEAWADYVAAASSGDSGIAEYVAQARGSFVARNLDNDVRADVAISGDPYLESLAYSGALWRTRARGSQAQAAVLDAAVLQAARSDDTRSDSTARELFGSVADTLRAQDQGDVATALEAELALRDVAGPSVSAVRMRAWLPDTELRSPAAFFLAPGKAAAHTNDIAPGLFQVRIDIPAGATKLRGTLRRNAYRTRPFGSQRTTAAALVALASWDSPVTWNAGHPAAEQRPFDAAFAFDVPAGARIAYLQIANAGDEDGGFDGLTISFASRATEAQPPSSSTGGCAITAHDVAPSSVPWPVIALSLSAFATRPARRRPSYLSQKQSAQRS